MKPTDVDWRHYLVMLAGIVFLATMTLLEAMR